MQTGPNIYLIGSLKNPAVPEFGVWLRSQGFNVFDDWFAPGPEADAFWRKFEVLRGHTYIKALQCEAAENALQYDKRHLDQCDGAVLLGPAGKSGHMELGYVRGKGLPAWALLPSEPADWDLMYKLMSGLFLNRTELATAMRQHFKMEPGNG